MESRVGKEEKERDISIVYFLVSPVIFIILTSVSDVLYVVDKGSSGFSFGSFGAKTTASTSFGLGTSTTSTASSGFGSKFMCPCI